MNVRYTEIALREVSEILSYIAERNVPAAQGIADRLERLLVLLGEFPLIGYSTDEYAVRVIPVVGYPFLIFYTVKDEVVILHVRHAAQLRP